eukprot:GFKZ01001225.1.p1 GENE.GFKZ01001225.1~~GFKZ01001225.1.p1  ORF type:complete len:544 (-),score=58.59 GFKZ01001225.1:413-1861(-)
MAVTDPIDVTPAFTVTTVQFQSEVLNGITTSLLTVFIIVNIGSVVSKLIYVSRGLDFHYDSWLRAFIFANSDDPLRILSWISRNYTYRKRSWTRNPNKLKLTRLIWPLLARGIIFTVSIVSVGITVPSTKVLSSCTQGDYRLELDPTAPRGPNNFKFTACLDVPLESERGRPRGTVSYCTCTVLPIGEDRPFLRVNHGNNDGSLEVIVSNGTSGGGQRSYVEWKIDGRSTLFRSQLPLSIDVDLHMRMASLEIQEQFGSNCVGLSEVVDGNPRVLEASLASCPFDEDVSLVELVGAIESRIRHAMTWRRVRNVQNRVAINRQSSGATTITECVLDVAVFRPVVNIIPLLIALVLLVLLNVIVSRIVSRHGNAFDAGFHLVKEVFGHDTTSNPLEENEEREEVQELELRYWRCGAAGAHVGFWGRRGDIPVADFTEDLIVCGCNRVDDEAEYMSAAGTDVASSTSASFSGMNFGQKMVGGIEP